LLGFFKEEAKTFPFPTNARHTDQIGSDELASVATVTAEITKVIGDRADALIARKAAIEKKTEQAFAPHEALMTAAENGLDQVEKALARLSNSPFRAPGWLNPWGSSDRESLT
jgi:hypothetical protein